MFVLVLLSLAGRAVRHTIYGIGLYADGYYMAAFPAITHTILERYRGPYGTVRYHITAVLRLYSCQILWYRANFKIIDILNILEQIINLPGMR
jgi:hypothetical protein